MDLLDDGRDDPGRLRHTARDLAGLAREHGRRGRRELVYDWHNLWHDLPEF
jgi:hypothetical protein